MGFTYQYGDNPAIDYPRLMVGDTVQFQADGVTRAYIFDDREIIMATNIETGAWQSSQFYTANGGAPSLLGGNATPYRRIAATLLDSICASQSRLAGVIQLQDVKLSVDKAAAALREAAAQLRDTDDNSGAFAIIEQVNNQFAFRDRFWKSIQRQWGGITVGNL